MGTQPKTDFRTPRHKQSDKGSQRHLHLHVPGNGYVYHQCLDGHINKEKE